MIDAVRAAADKVNVIMSDVSNKMGQQLLEADAEKKNVLNSLLAMEKERLMAVEEMEVVKDTESWMDDVECWVPKILEKMKENREREGRKMSGRSGMRALLIEAQEVADEKDVPGKITLFPDDDTQLAAWAKGELKNESPNVDKAVLKEWQAMVAATKEKAKNMLMVRYGVKNDNAKNMLMVRYDVNNERDVKNDKEAEADNVTQEEMEIEAAIEELVDRRNVAMVERRKLTRTAIVDIEYILNAMKEALVRYDKNSNL